MENNELPKPKRVTITNVFIVIYSAILVIPFVLALNFQAQFIELLDDRWWIIPLVISTVLGTAGPFIYLYFQRKEENRINTEQRRYQSILRDASLGMGEVKDLNRLLNLIVRIVTKTVGIRHSSIYLFHKDSQKYILKASRNRIRISESHSFILGDSSLVKYFNETKEPLLYSDIKSKLTYQRNNDLIQSAAIMQNLNAELAVPSYINDSLIAIFVLGMKKSGTPYTPSDLSVFSILANQSALAIENAQFIEEMKKTHKQIFKAEKMATIGTMADGLSHQINNRLHAMGFIAGDIIDSIRMSKTKNKLPSKTINLLDEVEYGFSRIEDNVKQGGGDC